MPTIKGLAACHNFLQLFHTEVFRQSMGNHHAFKYIIGETMNELYTLRANLKCSNAFVRKKMLSDMHYNTKLQEQREQTELLYRAD